MHPTHMPSLQSIDFNLTPFVAIWETTRSCDLACRHCRAEAISERLPGELDTSEGKALLDTLAEMGTPICVLSGGDPAKREDLFELVAHGAKLGMRMATIPAATQRLTLDLVRELKKAGLAQMAISLDGPTAELHDNFRGVKGSFDKTMEGAGYCQEVGLPFQVNTTLSRYNYAHLDAMTRLVSRIKAVFWEVFFLVPMGRGKDLNQLDADEFEDCFKKLAAFSKTVDFIIKVTEAPHYRRYLVQEFERAQARHATEAKIRNALSGNIPDHMRRDFGPEGSIGLAHKGVNAGNGHLFVSYCGDIYPSGFLPQLCGNIRRDSLAEVYRKHPTFRDLRNPDLLKGKCGVCGYRDICGGSRARAYALTQDILAEEPFCAHTPEE